MQACDKEAPGAGQSGRDVRSHSRAAAAGGAGAWRATAVRGGGQDLPGHPRLRPRPAAVLPRQAAAAGGEPTRPVHQPAARGGRRTRNLFDPLHGCHSVLCCRLAKLTVSAPPCLQYRSRPAADGLMGLLRGHSDKLSSPPPSPLFISPPFAFGNINLSDGQCGGRSICLLPSSLFHERDLVSIKCIVSMSGLALPILKLPHKTNKTL